MRGHGAHFGSGASLVPGESNIRNFAGFDTGGSFYAACRGRSRPKSPGILARFAREIIGHK